MPDLTDLIELNGGAVYSDEEGTVAFVAADGQRRLIGHQDPDSPLIASSQGGLVTWVDPGDPDDKGGAGRATLQVYDVNAGTMLDSRNVPATGVRPIAIDQNLVYYEEPDGTMRLVAGRRLGGPAGPQRSARRGVRQPGLPGRGTRSRWCSRSSASPSSGPARARSSLRAASWC